MNPVLFSHRGIGGLRDSLEILALKLKHLKCLILKRLLHQAEQIEIILTMVSSPPEKRRKCLFSDVAMMAYFSFFFFPCRYCGSFHLCTAMKGALWSVVLVPCKFLGRIA